MSPNQRRLVCITLAATIATTAAASEAQTTSGGSAASPKYVPDVPAKITTTDTVETRIGTLRFKDGAPDPATVQLAFDQITTVYVMMCVDLTDGPMVVQVPPRALGPVDDADFRWVTDVGLTGPDKGAGGDYLFVPIGHQGTVPETGFNVSKPRTNRLLIFYRVFVEKGDLAAATASVRPGVAVPPIDCAASRST